MLFLFYTILLRRMFRKGGYFTISKVVHLS